MKKDTRLILSFIAFISLLLAADTIPAVAVLTQHIGQLPLAIASVIFIAWILKASSGRGSWVTIMFGLTPCLLITMLKAQDLVTGLVA